jgi:hypothetical protein
MKMLRPPFGPFARPLGTAPEHAGVQYAEPDLESVVKKAGDTR